MRLSLEGFGDYYVQLMDTSARRVVARRTGGIGEAPSGVTVPAGTTVVSARATEPGSVLAGWGQGTSVQIINDATTAMRLKALEEQVEKIEKKVADARMDRKPSKRFPWLIRAEGAQQVQELHETLDALRGLELLNKVNSAVSLYYDEDATVPGVVTAALSCFPGDPQIHYASVVRYTGPAGAGKSVLAWAKAETLEDAIRGAARNWLDVLKGEKMKRQMEGSTEGGEEDLEARLLGSIEKSIKEKTPRVGDPVVPVIMGGKPVPVISGTIRDSTRVKA